jgi:acetyl esterase/lipase
MDAIPSNPLHGEPFVITPAQTSHIRRKFLDLVYGNRSPAQKLDLYLPDPDQGPFRVILSIHGGAFMGGDKGDVQLSPMLQGLERGFAVVGINYRLSGEALFPALIHDVKAALRWVRANAAKYNLRADKIAAWGGSAGGYLSTMLGVSAGIADLEDLSLGNSDQSSLVQAVVDWFGPTDFLKMDEQLEECGLKPSPAGRHNGAKSPESLLLGRQITEVPELVRIANPETYIHPAVPPFLIQHGTCDDTVPVGQSIHLAGALADAAGKDRVTLDLLDGARHTDPAFEIPANLTRVLDWLDEILV